MAVRRKQDQKPSSNGGPAMEELATKVAVPGRNKTAGRANTKSIPNGNVPGSRKETSPTTKQVTPKENLSGNGKGAGELGHMVPLEGLPALVADLQALQRQRSVVMKSRTMQANRLQAIIAGTMGYQAGMEEKDRTKVFKEAGDLIDAVAAGTADHPMREVILMSRVGIDAFTGLKKSLEVQMKLAAAKLPVAAWVEHPDQRGFSLLGLAIVIGETGDLFNYSTPCKVWKRLGCAPWTFGDKTLMGATWKSGLEGKLPASEWEAFGYSPRRRAIAYNVGVALLKQNFAVGVGEYNVADDDAHAGPYRERYLEAKADYQKRHPDHPLQRAHRHGMLVATKKLLKRLWQQWRKFEG